MFCFHGASVAVCRAKQLSNGISLYVLSRRHPRPCPTLTPLPRDFIDVINRAAQHRLLLFGCVVV